jgi:hypothetical protein
MFLKEGENLLSFIPDRDFALTVRRNLNWICITDQKIANG